MFKSKIDQNAFDLNNSKVKNVELNKVKALAKAAVKKLVANLGEPTTFHLILDYFKDQSEKPVSHFLSFGINKKMDKHFQQVEMKSGKMEQSMSAGPKEASMGEAYAKDDNGKIILCIEPDPKSKVPKGQWPKIIKALKPFLAGIKAVVLFEGQTIGEDAPETDVSDETTTTEQAETAADGTTATGIAEDAGEDTIESTTNTEVDSAAKAKREKTLETLNTGINKMDGAVGKVDKVKLQANVEKYEAALVKLVEEANADGVVDDQERAAITEAEEKLAALKLNIVENGGKLTPEKLEKVRENLGQIEKRLEQLFSGLGV